uniref:Putative HNH homing endonuclease n=1 Tax=Bracteacoccus giganteus TaxID=50039 RepID=A0A0S2LQT6_9CHLO|nr:putative HNH homing endonuclease [Bracteacoccus giganteus]YP_009185246.1 putative HNH homing endonuclease [Bracteacoccus giganteus]ALO63559.1 putative HNH homing endonuclease [Bracteacoccus giganteus]ALO63561.1 putative HNH homing endonuclease [Bracteacoccus giganteus]
MPYKLPISYAIQKHKAVELKAKQLGHVIEYGEYQVFSDETILNGELRSALQSAESYTQNQIRSEREALLKIRCNAHSSADAEPIETTYHNYLRARTGLPCCGKQRVSQKLQHRVFSEESRQKLSISMKQVWATKPRAKDPRDSINYDLWRKKAQQLGDYKCAITGTRPLNLAVHHLYSMSHFPSIMYDADNSVLLDREIHKEFHSIWHYRTPNTIDQFMQFLDYILSNPEFRHRVFSKAVARPVRKIKAETSDNIENLYDSSDLSHTTSVHIPQSQSIETTISSQSSEESDDGSETRVYDPERIKRLHERMAQLRETLYSQLTSDEKASISEAIFVSEHQLVSEDDST